MSPGAILLKAPAEVWHSGDGRWLTSGSRRIFDPLASLAGLALSALALGCACMARRQTFLARLCSLTLAIVFAAAAFTRRSDGWPSAIFGAVLALFCLLIFTFDVFWARVRKRFPFFRRFVVKPVRVAVSDDRTEVYYPDGRIVFSVTNQIVWRPGAKGGQVLAVGAPGEWLPSAPHVLPADAVHIDLVAEAFAATPRIDELCEAFFCYCIEASRRKVGFWRWFGRQFFSPLKVDVHIRDKTKNEFVGSVLRRSKFIGPANISTMTSAVDS